MYVALHSGAQYGSDGLCMTRGSCCDCTRQTLLGGGSHDNDQKNLQNLLRFGLGNGMGCGWNGNGNGMGTPLYSTLLASLK
jgi:hypothetical protein